MKTHSGFRKASFDLITVISILIIAFTIPAKENADPFEANIKIYTHV